MTMSSEKSSSADLQHFLHRPPQPVVLVDKQHIAGAEIGQDGGQIAARSMAGPEVILILTPISLATT